jgi:hypothetical protein
MVLKMKNKRNNHLYSWMLCDGKNTPIKFNKNGGITILNKSKKQKSIGYDLNGEVFDDTYSHFYEFDTHDLNNK